MTGKRSRDKGKRGELEIVHILGSKFKRTGYAGTDNPDVSSDWAVISVKNKAIPISLNKAFNELLKLESQEPDKNHYVAVKVNHNYLLVQRIEQFRDDRC